MKIRLHDNSLRLRLSRSEVARLAAGDPLTATTTFAPGQSLTTRLTPAPIPAPAVTFDNHTLTVSLPAAAIHKWSSTEDVGIYADHPLTLAIEKDFTCLHNPPANQDTFPNPNTPADH